jgi:hypothetical protein
VNAGKEVFVTFDFKTKKWSPPLVKGMFQHWMTSIDGQYLYLMTRGDDPKILRVSACLAEHSIGGEFEGFPSGHRRGY